MDQDKNSLPHARFGLPSAIAASPAKSGKGAAQSTFLPFFGTRLTDPRAARPLHPSLWEACCATGRLPLVLHPRLSNQVQDAQQQ